MFASLLSFLFFVTLTLLVYGTLALVIPRRARPFSLSKVLATFPLQCLVSVLFHVLVTRPNTGLRICQYIVFSHLFRCDENNIFVLRPHCMLVPHCAATLHGLVQFDIRNNAALKNTEAFSCALAVFDI